MRKKYVFALLGLLGFGVFLVAMSFISGNNFDVLNPKGIIADKQRSLMIVTVLLMLIIVVPVFVMTFAFAWKYRESNTRADYRPDWHGDTKLEITWWAIPLAIIAVLGVIIWQSSHDLDPYKPLQANKKPVNVQVVALEWKWLFIYPEENIASVNYLQFPEDTPVNFTITSDAPMNSFWIPQLGGQVYAMQGMSTKLHLQANDPGEFSGSSANLSGEGFAGMKFTAKATSDDEYRQWVTSVRQRADRLGNDEYTRLSEPSKNDSAATFALSEPKLFDNVIMKYMDPSRGSQNKAPSDQTDSSKEATHENHPEGAH